MTSIDASRLIKKIKVLSFYYEDDPSRPNVFLVCGYVSGTSRAEYISDTSWVQRALDVVGHKNANCFLVSWDNRTIDEIKRSIRRVLRMTDVFKAFAGLSDQLFLNSFSKKYNDTKVVGLFLCSLIKQYNPTGSKKVILMGHSLGGKIVRECLQCLYDGGHYGHKSLVTKAIFLAAACSNEYYLWVDASKATLRRSVSIYNPEDRVLRICFGYLHKLMKMKAPIGADMVAGLGPMRKGVRILSVNCHPLLKSVGPIDSVFGHNYSTVVPSLKEYLVV